MVMPILRLGDQGEEVRLLQAALNQAIKTRLTADGDFGPGTEGAVRFLQRKHGLEDTGVFRQLEYQILQPIIDRRLIRPSDFKRLAQAIGAAPSILMAIREVEGRGEGFLNNGKALILFERHQFYKAFARRHGTAAAEKVRSQYPNICHPVWDRAAYKGYEREYDRLAIAMQFDEEIALASTSWGLMQVMGFNYERAGYDDVFTMVHDMQESERLQMAAGVNFIRTDANLLLAVRQRNYAAIARLYNGSGYAANRYDVKIAKADDRLSKYNRMY